MPFTPFHWGPVLLLGVYTRKYLDFPALMISAVAVDFRAILVFFGLLDGPVHGFFHTFPGATIVAIVVAIGIGILRKEIEKIMGFLGFTQSISWPKIFAGSIIGAYSHIVLDAMIYEHMNPFYITEFNPFYGFMFTYEMYLFCTITGILGIYAFFKNSDKSFRSLYTELNRKI